MTGADLRLNCPECRAPLDPDVLACGCGFRAGRVEDVILLMTPGFRDRADRLEAALALERRARPQHRITDPAAFPHLPFGEATRDDPEWIARRHDLALVRSLLEKRPPGTVLEIGAWNGWLSHHLAEWGHDLAAVDVFGDPDDGLGAVRHYPRSWTAIRMDLRDLDLLDMRFDAIILNRCLQFAEMPAEYVRNLRERLQPGGLLLATGVQVFANPRAKAAAVSAARQRFRERHGMDLFLTDTRGYLDGGDRATLSAAGLRLFGYPHRRLGNWRSRWQPSRPWDGWGLLRRDADGDSPT